MQNPTSVPVMKKEPVPKVGSVSVTKPVTENRTVPVQNQNPQMQQKPVMQNYHQGQSIGHVSGQSPVAYRQP